MRRPGPADIVIAWRAPRASVSLIGRLMLPDRSEHACRTIDLSVSGAHLRSQVKALIGERVIAYLDGVGRIEGSIVRTTPRGFAIAIEGGLRGRTADRAAARGVEVEIVAGS